LGLAAYSDVIVVFVRVREIFVVRKVHLTAVLSLDLSVVSLMSVIITILPIPSSER
jgi:hypothetical protein